MPTMSFGRAVDAGLAAAMKTDPTVMTWGEDVRLLRKELLLTFGPERVLDTGISEAAFVHAGIGAALGGVRPVVDIMMTDFLGVAFSSIHNAITKFPDFSGGRVHLPMVIRSGVGGWYTDGGQHTQTLWGSLAAVPGVDVVVPSNPADAAGLMLAAVQSDRPVIYLEPKLLSEQWLDYLGGSSRSTVDFSSLLPSNGISGKVPARITPTPIGKAHVVREGADLALISAGVGVHRCLEAAQILAADGISAQVLDLRSIAPLDKSAILEAASLGKVVMVDEDYLRGGLSGEIAALILEAGMPVQFARVTVEGTIPFAPELEYAAMPNPERIVAASRRLCS